MGTLSPYPFCADYWFCVGIALLGQGILGVVRIKTAVSGFVGLKRTHIVMKPINLCVRFTPKIHALRKIRHQNQ